MVRNASHTDGGQPSSIRHSTRATPVQVVSEKKKPPRSLMTWPQAACSHDTPRMLRPSILWLQVSSFDGVYSDHACAVAYLTSIHTSLQTTVPKRSVCCTGPWSSFVSFADPCPHEACVAFLCGASKSTAPILQGQHPPNRLCDTSSAQRVGITYPTTGQARQYLVRYRQHEK